MSTINLFDYGVHLLEFFLAVLLIFLFVLLVTIALRYFYYLIYSAIDFTPPKLDRERRDRDSNTAVGKRKGLEVTNYEEHF